MRKVTPPHHRVYTRIGRSHIHGVGVLAIRPIRRGCYIFTGDDQPLVWVSASAVKRLPEEYQQLYNDFCILKNGLYGCPESFDQLTAAWYLNHSDRPNVACDEKFNFYALKEIARGEELTVDYRTFSDTDPEWFDLENGPGVCTARSHPRGSGRGKTDMQPNEALQRTAQKPRRR